MEKKILVAVDGSLYSFNAINYLSRLFTDLENVHIHLFCVVSNTMGQAGREWLNEGEILSVASPETRKNLQTAKRFMNEATLQMAHRGIAPEQVSTTVQFNRMSPAKDIMQEARKGMYDALVIGRRGLGRLEKLIVGSTSATILDICHDVPVWIIDGHVDSRKIILPIDGSPNSLRAADHLGFILDGNPHAEITLFNSEAMFAGKDKINPQEFYQQWGEEWCNDHLIRPDSLFHAPEQILLEHHVPAAKIHRLSTKKGFNPSSQIVRQALIDGFGTIVMGRRGGEIAKGIFKGVSDQVIATAEDVAVWIVG
ncbi:MAG: universal stress protein [Deltaproteobacteria bacterium RIFOXYD12_FULL_50_9]|nr:MAG: universal stress protein [Deltaproteobacteria bacterium RIFOXYD12_FULL_50_9]